MKYGVLRTRATYREELFRQVMDYCDKMTQETLNSIFAIFDTVEDTNKIIVSLSKYFIIDNNEYYQ
jgi:hypothetical protein